MTKVFQLSTYPFAPSFPLQTTPNPFYISLKMTSQSKTITSYDTEDYLDIEQVFTKMKQKVMMFLCD